MDVYLPRLGEISRYNVFHLVAANDKVLCRQYTVVPNGAGRPDLGGFALSKPGITTGLANFRRTTMPDDEALGSDALCGRCRVSARARAKGRRLESGSGRMPSLELLAWTASGTRKQAHDGDS